MLGLRSLSAWEKGLEPGPGMGLKEALRASVSWFRQGSPHAAPLLGGLCRGQGPLLGAGESRGSEISYHARGAHQVPDMCTVVCDRPSNYLFIGDTGFLKTSYFLLG